MTIQKFYSNGKLLLTGEYLVLDGAKAIALPTQCGQSLTIENIDEPIIHWTSFDADNSIWLEAQFPIDGLRGALVNETDDTKKRLLNLLVTAMQCNSKFLDDKHKGYKITTYLDFNRSWGLGTSSTLINNLGQWARVNPYRLLNKTFGGSGYDIACASANAPLVYVLDDPLNPTITKANFNPSFKDQLFFVYLNQKQNSREAITAYQNHKSQVKLAIKEIDSISSLILNSKNLFDFEQLIRKHEIIISQMIGLQPVKDLYFSDYGGEIKSLGAWGGDFILATSKHNPTAYFESKGYSTVIPYSKLILN